MKSAVRERPSKRDHIVREASRIFYQRGLAIGVDTLIEEVGIAKMTLYKHFPTKADLIVACLEYVDERYMARLQSDIVNADEPQEKVLAIFDGLKNWFSTPRFRGCAFVNAITELADPDHPAHAAVLAHKKKTRAWIAQLLDDCSIADSDLVARQIAQLIEGAISMAHIENDPVAADIAKATARQILQTATRK
ncbi:TetR family transcriptional regulator [Cupriavidus sp. TA19]|uniref:TetR/AcrR family transcriptional regulator n=1 Tax=Cupriavidus sp. TA19 TaxID=701108 RepID=UPI0027294181|nr:TetR family transcriptional regulator [Cupriavidus sp. TA19]GLC94272.1 TetR family transcriptional regulator [Cupriavidus sp. TA19]